MGEKYQVVAIPTSGKTLVGFKGSSPNPADLYPNRGNILLENNIYEILSQEECNPSRDPQVIVS
jgi:hypothetical protein